MTEGLVSLLCQIATQGSIYSLLQQRFLATLLSLVGGQLIVPADERKQLNALAVKYPLL